MTESQKKSIEKELEKNLTNNIMKYGLKKEAKGASRK